MLTKQYNDQSFNPFIQIDVRVWDSLDLYETRLYGHIKRRAGQNSSCWESLENMAAHTGIGRSKLITTIQSLVDRGFLKKKKSEVGRTDTYLLTPSKYWVLKSNPSTKRTKPVHETNIYPSTKRTSTRPSGKHKVDPCEVDPCEVDPCEVDPSTISLSLTEQPEKSAHADQESEILEAEFWDEEPEAPQPTRNSESTPIPPVSNPTPREGKIFPPCRTTETTAITPTGYLAKTEKRYSQALSRLELTELTQVLIDIYNRSKPSSWGTCTKLTAFLIKQVDELIRNYSQFVDINEAVESLKNDIGAAFVSLRGDKFYDNKDFGQKTIGFYLDAKNVDRLQKRAQVWYDRPQQAKEQLAHKIADERVNGTPCHLTGKILSGMILLSTTRRFKKYLGLPLDNPMRNGLPPLEHLQKYYPELLEG